MAVMAPLPADTRTRAMADYLSDGETGVLVAEGDPPAWRATLTTLLADPARTRTIGRAARRSVEERFNAERMWHEVAGVLRDRGLLAGGV